MISLHFSGGRTPSDFFFGGVSGAQIDAAQASGLQVWPRGNFGSDAEERAPSKMPPGSWFCRRLTAFGIFGLVQRGRITVDSLKCRFL